MGGLALNPGWGRSPEEAKSYPLQCSGLENSMDYSGIYWISCSLNIFDFLFYHQPEKTAFKRLARLDQAYPYYLCTWKSIDFRLLTTFAKFLPCGSLFSVWLDNLGTGILRESSLLFCLPQLEWRGNLTEIKVSQNWVIRSLCTFCSVSIIAFSAGIVSWKGFQCNNVINCKSNETDWKYETDLRFLFRL